MSIFTYSPEIYNPIENFFTHKKDDPKSFKSLIARRIKQLGSETSKGLTNTGELLDKIITGSVVSAPFVPEVAFPVLIGAAAGREAIDLEKEYIENSDLIKSMTGKLNEIDPEPEPEEPETVATHMTDYWG